jgi:serine/threonine protein kinase
LPLLTSTHLWITLPRLFYRDLKAIYIPLEVDLLVSRLLEKLSAVAPTCQQILSHITRSRPLVKRSRYICFSPPDIFRHNSLLIIGCEQIVSKYSLIRPIGHGAYGGNRRQYSHNWLELLLLLRINSGLLLYYSFPIVVISALDKETNKKIAIKKVPRAFEDPVDAKRILREILLMKRFTHENVRYKSTTCVHFDYQHRKTYGLFFYGPLLYRLPIICLCKVIRIIDIIPPPPTCEEYEDIYIVQVL